GHKNDEKIFDENSWTNLESNKIENYAKSKTFAEKRAWDFWRSLPEDSRFRFTVLNPTFVTGPVLSTVEHGSATIIGRMMDFRTFLAAPKVCLGVVDVRDVAKAHILSLKSEKSDGQRILITNEKPTWFSDFRDWLMEEFKDYGYLISPLKVPDWLLKIYAKTNIDPHSKAVVHRVGPELRFSNKKSEEIFGLQYIDPKTSLIDMVYSMIEKGMIKKPPLRKFMKNKINKSNKCHPEISVAQEKPLAA
ncbi:hypothetical protein FO519_010501, partial [Halicephalobus sp. NKZ332]